MNIDLLTLGDVLSNVVGDIAYFVIDVFVTPLAGLFARYISHVEDMPILKGILEEMLEYLTDNYPTLASVTFFEFCCGTALLLTLVIQLARWVIDTLSPD